MKTRLNITVEDTALAYIKSYAASKRTSVSQIIEGHLKSLAKSADQQHNIVEIMDQMNSPVDIDDSADLIKTYHEARGEKYGVYNIPEFLDLFNKPS